MKQRSKKCVTACSISHDDSQKQNDPINILLHLPIHQKKKRIIRSTTRIKASRLVKNKKKSKKLPSNEKFKKEALLKPCKNNFDAESLIDFKFISSGHKINEEKPNSFEIICSLKEYKDLSNDKVCATPDGNVPRKTEQHFTCEPVNVGINDPSYKISEDFDQKKHVFSKNDKVNSNIPKLNDESTSVCEEVRSSYGTKKHLTAKYESDSKEKKPKHDSTEKEMMPTKSLLSNTGKDHQANDTRILDIKQLVSSDKMISNNRNRKSNRISTHGLNSRNNKVRRNLRSNSKFLNATQDLVSVIDLSKDVDDYDNKQKKHNRNDNRSFIIQDHSLTDGKPSFCLNLGIQANDDNLDDVICLSSDSEDYDYLKVRENLSREISLKQNLNEQQSEDKTSNKSANRFTSQDTVLKTNKLAINNIEKSNNKTGKFVNDFIASHELLCGSILEKPLLSSTFLQQYENFKPEFKSEINSPPSSPPSSVDFTVSEVHTGVTLANSRGWRYLHRCERCKEYELYRSATDLAGEKKSDSEMCDCVPTTQETDDSATLNNNSFNQEFCFRNHQNTIDYYNPPVPILQSPFYSQNLNDSHNVSCMKMGSGDYVAVNSIKKTDNINTMVTANSKNIHNDDMSGNKQLRTINQNEKLRCDACHMMYNPRNNIDRTLHKDFHDHSINGIKWKSEWAKQNNLSSSSSHLFLKNSKNLFDEQKFDVNNIMQRDGLFKEVDLSKKNALKTICGFLEIVNKALGSAPADWLTEAYREVKSTTNNITSKILRNSIVSLGKAFVFVFRNRIVGFISFEKINNEHKKNNRANRVMDIGTEEVFELSDDNKYNFEDGLNLNSLPEVYGVSRVFVLEKFRRQGVASMMLNSALHKLVYGRNLSKFEICWSQTTFSGMKLARNFNSIRDTNSNRKFLRVYV